MDRIQQSIQSIQCEIRDPDFVSTAENFIEMWHVKNPNQRFDGVRALMQTMLQQIQLSLDLRTDSTNLLEDIQLVASIRKDSKSLDRFLTYTNVLRLCTQQLHEPTETDCLAIVGILGAWLEAAEHVISQRPELVFEPETQKSTKVKKPSRKSEKRAAQKAYDEMKKLRDQRISTHKGKWCMNTSEMSVDMMILSNSGWSCCGQIQQDSVCRKLLN